MRDWLNGNSQMVERENSPGFDVRYLEKKHVPFCRPKES